MTTTLARPDRVAGILVLVIGILTLGIATHFLFLRPPMLPEDAHFTGVPAGALPPRLAAWLTIVFRTWGGFVAGFGIVLVAIGAYLLTASPRVLRGGVALALVVAFGRFLLSNIELRSGFLPFLVVVSVVAAGAAVALLVQALRQRNRRGGFAPSRTALMMPSVFCATRSFCEASRCAYR